VMTIRSRTERSPLLQKTGKRPANPMGFVAALKRAAGVIASSSGRGARDEDRRGTERGRVSEAA
jgi:hypothetical protein